MLVTRCAILLLGIVLVQANPLFSCHGCGLCGGCGSCGSHTWGSQSSGCGLGSGESMCDGKSGGGGGGGGSGEVGEHCVPLVVRPQPVPRPALPLPVSFAPVAGPCACKKAIVKPAVLPKPVCRPASNSGSEHSSCCMSSCNCHHSCHSSSQGSSVMGGCGCGHGDYSPIVLDGNYNHGNCAPADAVSIALAQQIARQQCAASNIEDRLTFGFRKIPQELPKPKVMAKQSIPEEMIFDVNGQIVELKPVQMCCQKSLDEEAAEELMALEEEEHANEGCSHHQGFRQISLCELGYGPAKAPSNTFIDVPAAAVDAAASAVSGIAEGAASSALGSLGSAIGNAIGAAGSALGLSGSGSHGCNSGFVAGNVVFKTVPKPRPICVHPPADTTDCESSEEEQPSSEDAGESTHSHTGVCCIPCLHKVYKHSHASSSSSSSSCSKKAKVLIEKCSSF